MKKILTPEQIEAGNYTPETKRKYLFDYNKSIGAETASQKWNKQKELLRELAAKGLSHSEIAEKTGLAKIQVKNKVNHWKLGATSDRAKRKKIKFENKPVREKKAKVIQVVEKEKIIQPAPSKTLKKVEKFYECKVRDYSGQKLVSLGVNRMSFYVPVSFTYEQVEAEKLKRLQKYKSA